ncbi:putative HTH-type transcriptional regulator YdfH [Stieleria varia]|uniref:Putative HTH-type transcriptional regulator YdfH n=1 Tax=Stieleria varia TaxID=2528005 RepID=A0A5C6B1X8_9BACT|nr:putative HTH-type transcriptional regulator YdfH [Stieleria varia]
MISGDLAGGDRLVTQDLVNELNVSATPVREALAVLAGLGVVDLLPNRGAVIHQFTRREIRDISRVRRALECEAIRGACGRIPPSQLRHLEAEFERLSQSPIKGQRGINKARTLDTQLHDAIRQNCANAFLIRELERLGHLFRSFRDASWNDASSRNDSDRLAEEAAEHLLIVQSLRRKDSKAAVRHLSRHIAASSRYWSRVVEQGG